jgi:CheY-like chemotaxis protein
MKQCPECSFRDRLVVFSDKENQAIERISKVISSLKSFSYVQKSDENQYEELNIEQEVSSSVDFIRTVYEHKNISVIFECSVQNKKILGHSSLFQQVLMNLYSNARDVLVGRDNSQLCISLSEQEGWVYLTVKDNGPGITDEVLPKIFDYHFTTKPKGVGTGYGLSFVKKNIEKMKGTIEVQTTQGEGTSFILKFPVLPTKEMTNDKVDTTDISVEITSVDKQLNCLVVDDEQDIAEYLCYILEELGHSAKFVLSGAAALDIIQQETFDCIFTDIVMPQMSGQKLLRLLTQQKFPGKKIIVSGNYYPQGKSVTLNYDGHVEKPYSQDDIKKVLQKLFDN